MYGIIYRVYNLINKKNYIGQTIYSLEKRKRIHYSQYSNCTYFHRALMKYEEKDWEWSIIDYAQNQIQLDQKQKKWIAYYHSFGQGYNLTVGGKGSPQVVVTEQHKRKTRNTLLQSKINNYKDWTESPYKIIKCIETNKVYHSYSEAGREMGINYSVISYAVKNNAPVNGYHWKLLKGIEKLQHIKNAIYCVELDKFYESFKQARKEDRFHQGNLNLAMNKGDPYQEKHYAGYTFYWVNPSAHSVELTNNTTTKQICLASYASLFNRQSD